MKDHRSVLNWLNTLLRWPFFYLKCSFSAVQYIFTSSIKRVLLRRANESYIYDSTLKIVSNRPANFVYRCSLPRLLGDNLIRTVSNRTFSNLVNLQYL